MSTQFALRRYFSEGRIVLPILPHEKATRFPKWSDPDVRATEDDFGEDYNVAERLDHIVDIDCDTQETRKLAPRFLLNTGRVHGRPSLGPSHYWFESPGSKHESFPYLDKKPLVELRTGCGHYTVIPPSILMTKDDHPVPEAVTWYRDDAPGKVNAAGLRESVALLAACAILARHWPAGGRHNTTLAIAGMLANLNIHPKMVEVLLEELTRYTEGEAWSEIPTTVSATFAAKKANRKCTGAPELAKLIADGPEVVARIRGWFGGGSGNHAIVEELNAKHFVIRVGARDVIGSDAGEEYVFQKPESLRLRYANQLVKTSKKVKGKEIETQTSKFEIWLRHPTRREYRTITFAPPPVVPDPRDLNLWRGLAIEPRPGDCSKLVWHAEHIICAGDREHTEYLLDLLACGVQYPGERSEVSTVLRGGQGAGKGMFIRAYGEMFSPHFVHLDKPEQLTGKFNSQLSGKVVVFADEAFFAGDPTMEGPLKRLITEPTLQIERKGLDQVSERNCVHLFLATNRARAVPAGIDERRHFVLDVSESQAQNHDYFEALQHEIDHGGREAFLHLLLQRTVDRKRLRRAPDTRALREQQDASLSTEHQWWKDCLALASVDGHGWPSEISADDLFQAYLKWCDDMKINRRIRSSELGKKLQPLIKGSGAGLATETRTRVWKLIGVDAARANFDRLLGAGKSWGWEPRIDPRDSQFELRVEPEAPPF